jgi:hypothetical protein
LKVLWAVRRDSAPLKESKFREINQRVVSNIKFMIFLLTYGSCHRLSEHCDEDVVMPVGGYITVFCALRRAGGAR